MSHAGPTASGSLDSAPERDPRPVVRLPLAGMPGFVIAGVAGLLAILLFLVIDGRRRQPTEPRSGVNAGQANAFLSPPPLSIPAEASISLPPPTAIIVTSPLPPEPVRPPPRFYRPEPAPAAVTIVPVAPSSAADVTPGLPDQRHVSRLDGGRAAPALVIDEGEEAGPSAASIVAPGNASAAAAGQSSAVGEDTPVRATRIRSRSTIMATGTLIPAVLETPVDTAKPGLVRAVVSTDARGFDGARVLIPRGSRLIGEYQSEVRSGQNRILVTWMRLLRPDGVSIRLSSPAADSLGGAGIPGRVNSFFFQRFASAILQSALTVGVNLAARPGRGSVIVGLPAATATGQIGQALLPGNDLRPKITVKAGAAFNVFVARDLDFSGVAFSS